MRVSEVNKSLLMPRLSSGVSSKALGLCWGPAALSAVMLSSFGLLYSLIPIAIAAAAHAVLSWMYRQDLHAFPIYVQYARMGKRYHPDSREKLPPTFERPHKFGRGVRM